MTDPFANTAEAVFSPATRCFAIVPDDVAPLPRVPKAIYAGIGGSIAMKGAGDNDPMTWQNIPSGALIPFRASHILATGTTAGNLLGLL